MDALTLDFNYQFSSRICHALPRREELRQRSPRGVGSTVEMWKSQRLVRDKRWMLLASLLLQIHVKWTTFQRNLTSEMRKFQQLADTRQLFFSAILERRKIIAYWQIVINNIFFRWHHRSPRSESNYLKNQIPLVWDFCSSLLTVGNDCKILSEYLKGGKGASS